MQRLKNNSVQLFSRNKQRRTIRGVVSSQPFLTVSSHPLYFLSMHFRMFTLPSNCMMKWIEMTEVSPVNRIHFMRYYFALIFTQWHSSAELYLSNNLCISLRCWSSKVASFPVLLVYIIEGRQTGWQLSSCGNVAGSARPAIVPGI